MPDPVSAPSHPAWTATGLVFENCNCQVICPGHVHFSSLCTHERCIGYWVFRFDGGRFGPVDLTGVRAVVAYDSPQHMIQGGWTEIVIIDREATPEQREAIETILTGAAGGPWEVLDRFVERRLPTRFEAISIEEGDRVRRVAIEGLLEGAVEDLKGRDREQPVTFQNMFNQVHPPEQMIGRGTSRMDLGGIAVQTEDTHGLYSHFDWSVEAR
jgi:hypothetical protein